MRLVESNYDKYVVIIDRRMKKRVNERKVISFLYCECPAHETQTALDIYSVIAKELEK